MTVNFAFNIKKSNFRKIKYIIVGDNPGKVEFEKSQYFIGPSGRNLRSFFTDKGLVEDFEYECLIFNKTFLHTDKTNDLNEIKNKIGSDNFNRILDFTANEIANYSNNLKVPILIFGKSKLSKGKIFHPFWSTLKKLTHSDYIYVFSHPSNNNFIKEWNKHLKSENQKSNKELLLHIGRLNHDAIES